MDRRVQHGRAPFALEEPVNNSLLTVYMAARIRDDLRETSKHLRSMIGGKAIATLFAFANLAGLGKSSCARRLRLHIDRKAWREAAAMAARRRDRAMS
jgi:hypothetical protein